MLSKTSFGVAAAGAGICFIGYCIYFDRKRRSDPDFKKKLREIPWITPAIRRKIRRKNATHAKAKKSGSAKIRAKFETLRREIKADIRKQHDVYVNNLVGDVKADPKDFYRYINSQKKDAQGIPPLKKRNGGGVAQSESEKAAEFNGRRKAKQAPSSSKGGTEFPDPNNKEACERFFIQEVQLGEELLASGSIEEGVDHLANAVVICGQPQQLIQVFSQTLPPPVVQLLMLKIPVVKQRLTSHITESLITPTKKGPTVTVVEDDVE